jgi:hypothetical protein
MGLGPCTLSVTHRLYENTLDLVSIEGSGSGRTVLQPYPILGSLGTNLCDGTKI